MKIHSTKLKAAIKAATLIQAHWRGFQQKTKFMRLKLACIVIQMRVRQYLSRVNNNVNEEMICAALIIQKAWRGQKQRQIYKDMKEKMEIDAATTIQKYWRGHSVRQGFRLAALQPIVSVRAGFT